MSPVVFSGICFICIVTSKESACFVSFCIRYCFCSWVKEKYKYEPSFFSCVSALRAFLFKAVSAYEPCSVSSFSVDCVCVEHAVNVSIIDINRTVSHCLQ